MNLLGRLERLEAEWKREQPGRPAPHIVMYTVSYGDDVKVKRAEAEAEFRRMNPDWQGPIDGSSSHICLIQRTSIEAENGAPKHPDWRPYLDALEEPDKPESAGAIAAYEAAIQRAA